MKTTVASGGKMPVPSWSPGVTFALMVWCGYHDELTLWCNGLGDHHDKLTPWCDSLGGHHAELTPLVQWFGGYHDELTPTKCSKINYSL